MPGELIRYPASEDGLLKAVDALGTTPEAVATNLSAMGLQGRRDDAACCPIANYLRASVDEAVRDEVRIDDNDLYVRVDFADGGQADAIMAARAASGFVLRFDLGDFPDLIEGGPTSAA
jgi:hypothetical protein